MCTLWDPKCAHLLNIEGTFTRCAHCGIQNVRIYWMYLQYGFWTGLMIVRWAETWCQIYRLIIKLSVVFRLDIIIFIWYSYWITQRNGPNLIKINNNACYHKFLICNRKIYYGMGTQSCDLFSMPLSPFPFTLTTKSDSCLFETIF
jgi:hypothetical protein